MPDPGTEFDKSESATPDDEQRLGLGIQNPSFRKTRGIFPTNLD